ncbi:MAG: hypothetical protein ACM3ZD_01205 [Betaproteobacteria bacterium]
MTRRPYVLLACTVLPLFISGCAVVAVADAAVTVAATTVSVGAKTVGLAADATIGTARLIGRAITPADPKPADPKAASAKPAASKPIEPVVFPAEPAAPPPDRVPTPVAAEVLPVTQPEPVRAAPL